MSIEGRIAIDVGFTDTHTAAAVQSVQRISLTSTDAFATGKVAVLSGTASTASLQIANYSVTPSYRDASGNVVTFSVVRRIMFSWSGTNQRTLTDSEYDNFKLCSSSGAVALTQFLPSDTVAPLISSGTGTGTYTIVLYGT
jgi:hypothetical protein